MFEDDDIKDFDEELEAHANSEFSKPLFTDAEDEEVLQIRI